MGAMAKNTPKRKRPRPTSAAAADGGASGGESAWSSIPGHRLTVDIADKQSTAATEHQESDDDDSFDDDAFLNTAKWTSQHYEIDDDEAFHKTAETEFWDPDPKAKSNKFDATAKMDGANDDGMFLSLEVIPADSYQVQKVGDDTTGFVTKVVVKNEQEQKDSQTPNASVKDSKKPSSDEEGKLSKKERQKLKRKAKKEAAKERKRLKKEQGGEEGQAADSKSGDSNTARKSAEVQDTNETAADESLQQGIEQLQTSWSISAVGVTLHTTLCTGLHSLKYTYPTPIQSSTLSAAILGRRDIVGAAPTGSGKTLSFGLPILQYLLEEADKQEKQEAPREKKLPLQALILTPTRELAMQVTEELKRTSCNKVPIGTIVGGFAEVKQKRVLEKTRPPILVATPGRLWELMSSNDYSHLNHLSQLRFLVVDEADRMIKQGSFPQLKQIFELINLANPPPEDPNELEDESDDDDDEDRLRSLQGIKGEAKVVMLDDSILAAIERERNGDKSAPKPMEMDDDEYIEQLEADDSDNDSEVEEEEEEEPVHRQTFVYSATLTLPTSTHHLIKKDHSKKSSKKSKKGKRQPSTVDGAIAEMLDLAGAMGEMKVVDLSNLIPEGKSQQSKKAAKDKKSDKDAASKSDDAKKKKPPSMAARLPPGLTLGEIRCAQRHKDSHLYGYLVTTQQGSSGPCLVFCNSIAAVRRVGETLQTLGLPVKMLHAQMAQKSRLKSLESLRKPKSRSIVVASDVAARGLDIPSVATVIHYDCARAVDTFIHRAGRTARGMGEKAVGTSISLVAPAEEREHQKICQSVLGEESNKFEQAHIDGRLLSEAQERASLATKIVSCNDVESQASKNNKWLLDAANDAGLDVDDSMLESSLLDGDKRDRQRFIEAKRAKEQLRQLLAKPMRKQHFGKFLSGAGLRESIKAEKEVKPFVVKLKNGKRKKKA